MADNFFPALQNLNQIDPNIELINNFSNFYFPTNLMGLPIENLLAQLPESSGNSPGLFIHDHQDNSVSHLIISNGHNDGVGTKRKENSSPQGSENGKPRKNNAAGRGKKAKCDEKRRATEVVHVRAKRGQATDSHSLAERVRREKINEKFRCLQDIVPGCYKSMRMAVMLDEIINYVQSLQNQIEFLSMKLTAASTFHDFNLERDAMETILPYFQH